MKRSIRELGLPARVSNRLEYEGIRTIAALLKRTPWQLVEWPGFGLESYKSVHRTLASHGLSLKDDPGIRAVYEFIMQRDEERAKRNAAARRD